MSRKSARENAFKLLYQMSFRDITELNATIDIFFKENKIGSKDEEFIKHIAVGVVNRLDAVDGLIEQNASNWDNDRISKVDMAIIRVGVYEMLEMDDIPSGVSINEAVELAKRFGSDESSSFVNGVLGAIDKGLKKCDE